MAGRNVLIVGPKKDFVIGLIAAFQFRGYNVFAIVPNLDHDFGLWGNVQLNPSRVTLIHLDYMDVDSMTAAVRTFGEDRTLDVLINCAGFESANRTVHPQFWYRGAGEDMMFLYRIMTVGPLITYERFLPNLKRSALGKVVNIACAFTDARDAQYRFAHAGLKSLSKLIAHDVRFRGDNIAVLCLDPGDAPFVYDRSNEAAIQALGDCVQDIYLEIEQATLADSETF